MGRLDRTTRAKQLVIERFRVYTLKRTLKDGTKTEYPCVAVFVRNVMDARLIKETYGGGYYTHGTGFVWTTSKRATLRTLIEEIGEPLIKALGPS